MLVAALALVPALALAEPPGLDLWSKRHPEASRELGEWVRQHPQAAKLMFEWDGTHPARSKEFVTWAIAFPAQPIETFIQTHPGWPVFDQIVGTHRPAANAFMGWCRRHPPAAETLMNHPGGLRWAGDHLYAEYWSLERPRR
jgi:hypothetical protein